jgi:prepilin-type N-terminal cleavage/methylation domain-containing protein
MVRHDHKTSHGAFTLIELLIVIAIIGTLLALLLPAIQAASEASRRSSCQHNLRRIALALLSYENEHRVFPVGAANHTAADSLSPTFSVSWWVSITPYLDEVALFSRLDLRSSNNGWAVLHPENGRLVDNVLISCMLCPSSSIPWSYPVGGFEIAMPSYVGISGATSHDGYPERRVSRCCVPENSGEISGGGILIANSAVSQRQIADGTSKTMVVGETSDLIFDKKGRQRRIDGGFPNGWISGTYAAGTPPAYDESRFAPSWNIATIRYPLNTRDYELPGIDDNRGANNPLVSAHPGGICVANADGSVRFLSDGLDVRELKMLATRDDSMAILSASP